MRYWSVCHSVNFQKVIFHCFEKGQIEKSLHRELLDEYEISFELLTSFSKLHKQSIIKLSGSDVNP